MKTCFIILFALTAGALSAQPPSNQDLETTTPALTHETQETFKPQEKDYAVHHGRVTYDGVAVQAVMASNHLEIFNPLDPANSPAPDNTVWRDKTTGKAAGWSIFSIKF